MKIAELLPPAVALAADGQSLRIIDQTQLPTRQEILCLSRPAQIYEAIYHLRVRGAPAIGIAAAYGLYLAAAQSSAADKATLLGELQQIGAYLNSARPTAVNLSWAINRMLACAEAGPQQPARLIANLKAEAQAIEAEDAATCRAIGEFGLSLISDGDGLLTHCNAGHLATARYGTALAPFYLALEHGLKLRLYCDETRPLLQGMRLTAYELQAVGADVTLLCDNMAAGLMAQGLIQAVFVGADRIAANGDTANKTGTLGLAVLARHFGLPFYICAPTSTIDSNCNSGNDIVIEQRPATEITDLMFAQTLAPAGVKVYNPAFDITPAALITAIITEQGIQRPSYNFL